ncbi:MAG: hypothetical protein Q4C25_01730 [Bacillota bacterium]|nr:hypothetical protein [Bacillota bacterium]
MGAKKELQYFQIGNAYGGSQRWMKDPWMHIGGCGALTNCDTCIYLALYHDMKELCPVDPATLTKKEYVKFAMSMKLYLRPRNTGIKDLPTYIHGAMSYFEDSGVRSLSMEGFEGSRPLAEAREAIRKQIDIDIPIPYLMLKHHDNAFNFFEWHWFLVNGYDEREDGFYIKVATYGKAHWLSLDRLWDTQEEEKGGLVLIRI